MSALESFVLLACLLIIAPTLPAQDFQPQPVSEYAEKTGPNTIAFLSYPKYYTDSEGKLTPVITDLVASKSPDWDFEVVTGIWTLRVRADGTFQAEHAGNVFTYRLAQIGVGRGEAFQPFDWGEPNWKNYQVIGDKIRWYNVFPDVDLVVRYINDILKVDAIVKANLMSQIRGEVQKGSLNADDYLTARFDIPNVWITTEAQLGGEKVDIYAERLDLQQSLEFVKDGKVVQRLRPVETYVLDDKGERIESFDEDKAIRTAQTWRLKKDAAGIAEMSANLGDLARAPEGDVVIDPSFQYPDFNYPLKDTCLLMDNPTYSSGPDTELHWTPKDHVLLSWLIQDTMIPSSCTINSATIQFYIQGLYNGFSTHTIQSHSVPETWEESATWNKRLLTPSTNWQYSGAIDLADPPNPGDSCTLSSAGWKEIVVTVPFNSYFPTNRSDIGNKGFLLRMTSTSGSGYANFITKENANTSLRAKLIVNLKACSQGTAYYPFLKRKDGNVNNYQHRWFPIGTYFMLEAIDPAHYSGWPSGNLESMAQKSYGNYFNCINPLENVDERGKRSVVDDIFVAHTYEFTSMLSKMDSLYTVDYKMLPVVTAVLKTATFVTTDRFGGNSTTYPWDIFSEASYYPRPFSWSNEAAQVIELATTIQSHSRVYGWHYGDEPYGGHGAEDYSMAFRQYLHNNLAAYMNNIESHDSQYQHPSYLNLRAWGNYFSSTSGDTIQNLNPGWIDKLDIQDYILDSSNYRYDMERLNKWQDGVYVVESLIQFGLSQGYGKGYCRFAQSKNIGDATRMTIHEPNCYEKDRYLAYSSWVCGGQGLMFFRYDSNTTQDWFEYDGNGICAQLLKEAYTMRNWLMNSPATNILSAYAYDSLGSSRVRFILRRDQTGGDSRVLVLFCNFANDGQSHTTYIHFPNQAINTIAKVNADMKGTYSKENSDHTIKFVPDTFYGSNNKSIYGSACYITFQ